MIKKDFECCGVSYLNDGNIDAFIKIANINLEKIDCDFDYVLTDCASCEEVLKTYKDYATSPNAQKVCEKTISVVDLIKKIKFVCNKNLKIAVHKPCHDDYDFIDIVKNIDGITYVEAEDFDKGGQGVGFYDTSKSNQGGKYRTESSDFVGLGEGGTGYYVGWTATGEWLYYSVDVQEAGVYRMDINY